MGIPAKYKYTKGRAHLYTSECDSQFSTKLAFLLIFLGLPCFHKNLGNVDQQMVSILKVESELTYLYN